MLRYWKLAVFLAAVWLGLSGFFTPLLLGFGVVSVLLVVWIASRMDAVDREPHPLALAPVASLIYFGWLLKEIALSNIQVAKLILRRDLPISPSMITVDSTQRSTLGHVIFANSITLTPGTVSINLQGDRVQVHALTREGAEALAEGEMDRRVAQIESSVLPQSPRLPR